jgi:hypothetical protein
VIADHIKIGDEWVPLSEKWDTIYEDKWKEVFTDEYIWNIKTVMGRENLEAAEENLGIAAEVLEAVLEKIILNQTLSTVYLEADSFYASFDRAAHVDAIRVDLLAAQYGLPASKVITARTMYPQDRNFIDSFKLLLNASEQGKEVAEVFESALGSILSGGFLNEDFIFEKDNITFHIIVTPTVDGEMYFFEYQEIIK